MKKVIVYGLASHAALAAVAFMIVAGSLGLPALTRAAAMTALAGWVISLLLLLAFARAAWEQCDRSRRLGLIALALPGWTLGFPIALLIALRPGRLDAQTYAEA